MRRSFLKQLAALSAVTAAYPTLSFAQDDWPNRPIRILVPYPPGGLVDPVARVLASKLQPLLGQPVVVENRPGANTAIAASAVNKAPPDGYMLVYTSIATHAIHTIQAPRGYDSVTGFTPIANAATGDFLMAINASVPANTVPEFIAYVKAHPDEISAGASGPGNADQLAAEMFRMSTGTKLTTVPYKGSAAALTDLVAGRVQMMITTETVLQPQIDTGKLRMLAYTDVPADKHAAPTLDQYGLKGFEVFKASGILLGPPNMPAAIVSKLSNAMQRVLEMPDTQSALSAMKQTAAYIPPNVLRERMVVASATFADIIKKANIKFE